MHRLSAIVLSCVITCLTLLQGWSFPHLAAARSTTVDSSASTASLSVVANTAGVTVQSLDSASTGWQAFFNASQGGGITSVHEIDAGASTELMQQAVLHALVQCYLQIGGNFVSNQQPGAQLTVLRDTPQLVIVRTVSSNPTYHVTWTYTYTIWPDAEMYIRLNIQNTGSTTLTLSVPDSVEINHDGQVLADYPDQASLAWYARAGTVTSPIPSSIAAIEPGLFGRIPTSSSTNTIGFLLDKLTTWSDAGGASYGMRDFSGGTNGRAKDQWMGSFSKFSAGRTLSFSLMEVLTRRLTPAQSVAVDADYRQPGLTVFDGTLASADVEPNPITLTNGFNPDLGAYVMVANGNHMSVQLAFPTGVAVRSAPRFKLTNWSAGAPTVTWGGRPLEPGREYRYVLDPATSTLYLQLAFDVVPSAAHGSQQVNAPLEVSGPPVETTTPEPTATDSAPPTTSVPDSSSPTNTPVPTSSPPPTASPAPTSTPTATTTLTATNTPVPPASTPVSSSIPILSGAVLRADTFARANSSSGWGAASDGNTWTALSGSTAPGGTVGITGNKGTLTSSTASLFAVLGSAVTSADQEGIVRWSIHSTSATAGIMLRAQDSDNYYLARYGGNGLIQLYTRVKGVTTRSTAFPFTPGIGPLYWMRFQVKGTALSLKVWADGTAEPTTWGYATTDTSLSAPGSVGLYGYASTGTANTFDSFTLTAS